MALIGAVPCMDSEQEALLKFKEGFRGASESFSSWTAEEDCCNWRGVGCDNTTGHVTILDLHGRDPYNILQAHEYSWKPHLESLDLSGNGFSLRAENLSWVYGLSSLKVLDLGGVDPSNAEDWLDAVNMLPSLVKLRLFYCKLSKLPQNLYHVNFTSLKFLDLSFNNFSSTIPNWLFDIGHSLVYLNLSRCQLQGVIADAFGNLASLISLDLSKNGLEGPIPLTLGLFQEQGELNRSSSLRELYLSSNGLNGSLARSLPQFSQLVVLDVAMNCMEDSTKEAHLLKFSSLRVLDLSSNSLALEVSSSWIPPFQLETIGLRSCLLGPKFPQYWLRSQKSFSAIDISNSGIVDVVPDWFWNLSSRIMNMNLSFNELKGNVPDFSSQLQLSQLDLTSNNFWSPLPRFSANSRIPDCWKYGYHLVTLNLANNNLSRQIPNSMGQLIHLKTLQLENNSLSGEVPLSLKTCTDLTVLNLAKNRLLGNVPAWISENLQNLEFLSLSSNSLSGNIPTQLCQLKYLNYLNLSSNNLTGTIPSCVFPGMVSLEVMHYPYMSYPYMAYSDGVKLTFNFREFIRNHRSYYFSNYFSYVLDLSSNNLSGKDSHRSNEPRRIAILEFVKKSSGRTYPTKHR
ncbi:LRR receptor-like serine/threonine-protein kinase SIK1 [Quercus suber]|uniref:LRR receptor-like serine/threonine-protein kinase SIK1 n=1 Tax=Quercus suber TaxID=58331 RepID=UPI0032DF1E45